MENENSDSTIERRKNMLFLQPRRNRANRCGLLMRVFVLGYVGMVLHQWVAESVTAAENLVELTGRNYTVTVGKDLRLAVHRGEERLWESSSAQLPRITVGVSPDETTNQLLANASSVATSEFTEDRYRGRALRLSGYETLNVELELTFALDEKTDELLVQIEQIGGQDIVRSVEHLYRFEKPVSQGGYLVLPHGSGHLIPADCPHALPGAHGESGGLIGLRWSMPVFGMVRDGHGMCAVVESWWDCNALGEHVPDDRSSFDFHWVPSLGRLAYPRRFQIRFGQDMDYAAMAKHYRQVAQTQGLVRTLTEKARELPTVEDYVHSILYRTAAWNDEYLQASLDDIQKLKDLGLEMPINFFFPKFGAYWQQWLHPEPQAGGWPLIVDYERRARSLGVQIQCMVIHGHQLPADDPRVPPGTYDEDRNALAEDGNPAPSSFTSTDDAVARIKRVLDGAESHGFKTDSVYFDAYSAHQGPPEDFSPNHVCSRRKNFENQMACFAECRRRGIISGGELARFWAIPECTFFFFTDWSNDRLINTPNRGAVDHIGVPVPMFQLIFHDCYVAGFSGGGYAIYNAGYDWWPHRTPRLYELLFCSVPAHNWLPNGYSPVREWDSTAMVKHWEWIKTWSKYQRGIATVKLVSHQFQDDWKHHRIEFANGVVAEFDMANNRYRITGLADFDGTWQTPPDLY